MGLSEVYDRNNKGETEADNLGQALYLVSLVSERTFTFPTEITTIEPLILPLANRDYPLTWEQRASEPN